MIYAQTFFSSSFFTLNDSIDSDYGRMVWVGLGSCFLIGFFVMLMTRGILATWSSRLRGKLISIRHKPAVGTRDVHIMA